jgi:hypothetical protein
MRKLVSLTLCLALVLTALPVLADHPGSATSRDVQRLQDELVTLEDTLRDVPPNHARATEFRDRAEEIRESVTYLKVQMRRHQRGQNAAGLGASLEDVDWVRKDIQTLQNDVYTALNRRYSGGEAALREGTEIQVRLDQPLSSATARVEDRVEGTVIAPVELDNRVVIPSGTRARGVVRRVERAERPAKGGTLELTFDTLLFDDNTRLAMSSRVIAVRETLDRSESAQKAGIGAALGAILGSVIGGKKGALVGILVGGTGAVAATKGEDVVMPEGTILSLNLDRPLTVRR